MLAAADHDKCRRAQQRHAADGEHPRAVAACLGQVEAGVIDHGQRHNSVALAHGDILAVDGGGDGQQFGTALLALATLSGLDNDLDRVLQQHIALVGSNFGQAVSIVLQPFDHDVAAAVGDKGRGIRLFAGDTLGVVDAILQVCDDIAVVCIVMQPELHVPQVAAVVRKPLENVDTVGIHVAAILEGIKVGVVRSAPRQHDLIGVVGISHLGIGGQGGSVSNTHGAVAITALHAVGMHGGRLVDLRQASLSHPDGHNVLCIIIGNGELAGIFIPGGDLVSAASVLKELNDHIVLVVANAPAQCVHIGVLAQSRCLGGDGGQGADNLVVHGISHGGGSGKVNGFDYYDVKKGTVESGSTSRIAMWMLDTDYDGMCIEPKQVFFPMGGKKDGWNKLAKTLRAEIDPDLIEKYAGNESLWFMAEPNTRIAVKIIDDRGIESLKVIRIGDE